MYITWKKFFCRVVEFASYGDLKNAIEKLSGKEINGRKIKLIEGSKRHRYLFDIFQSDLLFNGFVGPAT